MKLSISFMIGKILKNKAKTLKMIYEEFPFEFKQGNWKVINAFI